MQEQHFRHNQSNIALLSSVTLPILGVFRLNKSNYVGIAFSMQLEHDSVTVCRYSSDFRGFQIIISRIMQKSRFQRNQSTIALLFTVTLLISRVLLIYITFTSQSHLHLHMIKKLPLIKAIYSSYSGALPITSSYYRALPTTSAEQNYLTNCISLVQMVTRLAQMVYMLVAK